MPRSRKPSQLRLDSRTRGKRVLMGLCTALMALLAVPRQMSAQEMEVPVPLQISLFLKVISFDRQRSQSSDGSWVVGIAYQSGFRASSAARSEVEKALRNNKDRKVRVVQIDLDRDDLASTLQQQRVSVLYVAPLRAYNINVLANVASAAKATTITGVPHYVEQGLTVGARLIGENAKIMVSMSAARKCGADFSAELLKLAQVLP